MLNQGICDKTKVGEICSVAKQIKLDCLEDSSITIDDKNVMSLIRTPEVNQNVSFIAAIPSIRSLVLSLQQKIGNSENVKGIVMDGRDIGTVVFPKAQLKIFLVADPKTRALRRAIEMRQAGFEPNEEQLMKDLLERDRIDSERAIAPLKKADDAIEIDTSTVSFDEQVQKIVALAKERIQ